MFILVANVINQGEANNVALHVLMIMKKNELKSYITQHGYLITGIMTLHMTRL